jgi:hypothetical protein
METYDSLVEIADLAVKGLVNCHDHHITETLFRQILAECDQILTRVADCQMAFIRKVIEEEEDRACFASPELATLAPQSSL